MKAEDVKKGLRYFDNWGEWRVMAVAEGYYMVRRKGCVPTVFKVNDLVLAVTTGRLSLDGIVRPITIPLAHVESGA